MKKGLWITILLAMVSAAGLCGAWLWAGGQKDDVVFTETPIFGQKEAAEGATLQLRASITNMHDSNGNADAIWITDMTLGEPNDIVTALEDDREPLRTQPVDLREASCRITISTPIVIASGAEDFTVKESSNRWTVETYGLEELQDAVAAKTAPGQTHTEVVRYADFFEYYPLQISASLPSNLVGGDEQAIEQTWEEYFKVPVDPDYQVRVSVTKDAAGEITDFQIRSAHDDEQVLKEEPYWNVVETPQKDALYYRVTGRGTAGDGFDGIYCLPVRTEDNGRVYVDHKGFRRVEEDIPGITSPLGTTSEVKIFSPDADTFTVSSWKEGSDYEPVFTANIHPDDPVREAREVEAAWNGQQLLIWYRYFSYFEYPEGLPWGSFYLSVYNIDGTCYGARFDASYNVRGSMSVISSWMEPLELLGSGPQGLHLPYNQF